MKAELGTACWPTEPACTAGCDDSKQQHSHIMQTTLRPGPAARICIYLENSANFFGSFDGTNWSVMELIDK
eukprot:3937735-Pleurochrysis_carterae.AAC.1